MDRQSVMEFLGGVPLLQMLPSSSVRKIAELVVVRHYDAGDYVTREGERGEGVYFIWEGDAEITSQDSEDGTNRPEIQLKKYDYFGYGAFSSVHEVDLFRGFNFPDAPTFGNVFGGQLVGQALAAACKTVDSRKLVYSLHACFLLGGNLNLPICYKVHRLLEGKSFATRRVDAVQQGNVRFTLLASFQKEEQGFDHQEVKMPYVPDPETVPPMEKLPDLHIYGPFLPVDYWTKIARGNYVPWPIDIRFCERRNSTNQTKSSLKYWFRAREKLSDDPALHRCVVAYASDLIFLRVSLNPHRGEGFETASLSLDHAMWFHRSCRADEWLLYVIESPSASNARGFCSGRIFNRQGQLVISLAQEGVIRKARPPKTTPTSKL